MRMIDLEMDVNVNGRIDSGEIVFVLRVVSGANLVFPLVD